MDPVEAMRKKVWDNDFLEAVENWANDCGKNESGCVPVRHDYLHELARRYLSLKRIRDDIMSR